MSNRAASHVPRLQAYNSPAYQNQPQDFPPTSPKSGHRWGCSLSLGEEESMTKWVCSFLISPGFPGEVVFLDDGVQGV